MLKRDSKFPGETRQTSVERNSGGIVFRLLRRPLLIMLVIAAGIYIYEMPERPWQPYIDWDPYVEWEPYAEQMENLWGELFGEDNRGPVIEQARQGGVNSTQEKATPQTIPEPSVETVDPASVVEAIRLDVSIGVGFRPVGFKIGAVTQAVKLSERPSPQISKLPKFISPHQRYGKISLAGGMEYSFALDLVSIDYQLYLDRNRNGDLSDDGSPYNNEGRNMFAGGLLFPLKDVTGVPELEGDYKIWLYTKEETWQRWKMLYFSMTQLQGELILSGKRYTAFLADNGPVDGDYRNDGINIDLDGNGKIDRETEFFPDGAVARIDGINYLFRVTH
jgi:hypothetical protein